LRSIIFRSAGYFSDVFTNNKGKPGGIQVLEKIVGPAYRATANGSLFQTQCGRLSHFAIHYHGSAGSNRHLRRRLFPLREASANGRWFQTGREENYNL